MNVSAVDSLMLAGVLAAAVALLAAAQVVRIPYPILLVLGGLAIGFVPEMPHVQLPPDLVLVGVLPALLYGTAFFTPLRELHANVRRVSLLAVGLVLATMVAVATVAHEVIPRLDWATAFTLGAIVAPTDPQYRPLKNAAYRHVLLPQKATQGVVASVVLATLFAKSGND